MESFYYLGLEGQFLGKPHKFLSSDSAWVELMVETGYVGLLILASLLIKAALTALRNFWNMPKPDKYLSLVLFISMVEYYFMMTNVGLYSWGQNGHMLWILVALAMKYGKLKRTGRATQEEELALPQFLKYSGEGAQLQPCRQ
jgi:hypothetical protein